MGSKTTNNRHDTIWAGFSHNPSGCEVRKALVEALYKRIQSVLDSGKMPTFLQFPEIAQAGIKGVRTLSIARKRSSEMRGHGHEIIIGTVASINTRRRLFSRLRRVKSLLLVRFDFGLLDTLSPKRALTRLRTRALLLQLFEELDNGGVIWLPDIYARDLAPLARILRTKGARIHSFLEDRNMLIEKRAK